MHQKMRQWQLKHLEPIGVPQSIHFGKLHGVRTTGRIMSRLLADEYAKSHFHVLQHFDCVTSYIDEHKDLLKTIHPGRKRIDSIHTAEFNSWLKRKLCDVDTGNSDLHYLARGPAWECRKFQGYQINGYTFGTKERDAMTVTQNSGVSLKAQEADGEFRIYYGYIEEILELEYVDFLIALFRCRWVNKNNVKPDDDGYTTVNLEHMIPNDKEPYILAQLVHQVFYIVDPKNKNRHMVMESKKSIISVDGVISEEEYNRID